MNILFSITVVAFLVTHCESKKQHSVIYDIIDVESLLRVPSGEKVVEIKTYIRKAFSWKRGMDEGDVIMASYVVNYKGIVSNLKIIRHPMYCSLCENEFIRIMNNLPKLIPAKRAGKDVSIKMKTIYHFEPQGLGRWE